MTADFLFLIIYFQGIQKTVKQHLFLSSSFITARREWNIFKGVKGKTINPEFYIQQKYPSGIKTLFRYKRTNKIHHLYNYTTKNAKGRSSG